MTEFSKMWLTHIYYHYFLILALFSSLFYWFHGDWLSWVRLFVILVLPLPIVWRRERRKEEKLPISRFGALVLIGLFVMPLGYEEGAAVIACCFYMAALVLWFVNKYLTGRYTVLHCNPSVSDETKGKVAQLQHRPLFCLIAFGIVLLSLLLLVSFFMPDIHWQSKEHTDKERLEQDNMIDSQSEEKTNKVKQKIQEEQEKASENFWLQLLKYLITVVIVVMGVVAVVYAVFRLFLFLMGRHRKVSYEYQEKVEIVNDFEEITRLVPVVKNVMDFSKDWNGKIRKAFYQSVRRGAGKHTVDRTLTPEEMQEAYLSGSKEDELLITLYEKARYAEERMNEEDWKQWEKVRNS